MTRKHPPKTICELLRRKPPCDQCFGAPDHSINTNHSQRTRTDKLGTTVWEHAVRAQKTRDRFRGAEQTETGAGTGRRPTLSLPNPPPAYTAT